MTVEQPRYMQILNVLSQRVETGQYPLEERLPTESELCDEFGASRFTVREALRRLVDHGMVQRRQGAGSIVVAASPKARYVHSLSSLADLSQFALDTHYELISSSPTKLPAGIAAQIDGKTGSRWWLITGLRRAELARQCHLLRTYVPAGAVVPLCAGTARLHRAVSRASGQADWRGHRRNRTGFAWRANGQGCGQQSRAKARYDQRVCVAPLRDSQGNACRFL